MKPPRATSTQRPAAGNVVSLTVHKNTKVKRRSKDLRDNLIDFAKGAYAERPMEGYVVVALPPPEKLLWRRKETFPNIAYCVMRLTSFV